MPVLSRGVRRSLPDWMPVLLLAIVCAVFASLSPRFLSRDNLLNVVLQSSSVGVVAVGMTLVLLTGGIDLSVGSIMFLSAAVTGKLVLADPPLPVAAAVLLFVPVGLLLGAVNAGFVVGFGMLPFVVTLATLYVGRGVALGLTQTRAMNLPEGFLVIGHYRAAGVPLPVALFLGVAAVAHVVLTRTPFGRQLYAIGADAEGARKAGIRVGRLLATVYVLSGLCASLAGVVSVAQLGSVSPTFGYQREFAAVAAAVLGGTSLFGGRGKVFPGTVVGAVLIQAIDNGLNLVNANPYVYPVVTGAVVFTAVLIDRAQTAVIERRVPERA
jgi:ribose transport system permease protein